MKILVVGFGQCGSNIADSFARMGKRARARRRIEIVTGAFAVNTDLTDLSGLSHVPPDYRHRILMGGRKSGGHGVGKVRELAAEIAAEDGDKVIDAIRGTPRFFESDAILLCAGAAGGTGSGSLPVMTQMLKERYIDVPIYNLIVLPFEHEEQTQERTIHNAAACIGSANAVAEAVFLVDNQRYVRKDASLRGNLDSINSLIIEPFYNILCAGEEKKAKYVGARVLDASDIIQCISGWTVMGYGRTSLRAFRLPFLSSGPSGQKGHKIHRGIETIDKAISELSCGCNPEDAGGALYLVTAPSNEISVNVVQDLGGHLKRLAPAAVMRNGDYPRGTGTMEVSVVLSDLKNVERIRRYFTEATEIEEGTAQQQEHTDSPAAMGEAADTRPEFPGGESTEREPPGE
jgi:cell division GTPase FtsZ